MGKVLLTQRQVAKRCNVTVESVRKWRRAGRLQFINLGHRSVRIEEQELNRFIAEGRVCKSQD
jgi:excisionase family DNA binding protein